LRGDYKGRRAAQKKEAARAASRKFVLSSAGLEASATAAATSATVATAAATGAILLGPGLVDGQGTAIVLLAVEVGDGGLGLVIGRHFDEAEAAAGAGSAVGDDLGALDGPVSREEILEVRAAHVVAQISDVKFPAHCKLQFAGRGPALT